MNDADVAPFFATLRDANPEPATELDYTSVFELLISVLLSAQTTDKRVNQVTKALFAAGPTAAKMLALGAETIEAMIKPVGFFRMKTKSVLATCRSLLGSFREGKEADSSARDNLKTFALAEAAYAAAASGRSVKPMAYP